MNLYRPDDGFDLKELSDERLVEYRDLHLWAYRYMILSILTIPVSIVLAIQDRWWYALSSWILGNISSGISMYYHKKAHEVSHG